MTRDRSEEVSQRVLQKRQEQDYQVEIRRVSRIEALAGILFPPGVSAYFAWTMCTVQHGEGQGQCQWVDLAYVLPGKEEKLHILLEHEFARGPGTLEDQIHVLMIQIAHQLSLSEEKGQR